MEWSATQLNSQVTVKDGQSQLIVTIRLSNEKGISVDVVIPLNANDGRTTLKTKIKKITDEIDRINVIKEDLDSTPQIDTSPLVSENKTPSRIL